MQIFATGFVDSTRKISSRITTRHDDDAALVGRIAAGDCDAMRSLFQRHKLRVYRFLLRLVDNEAVADDLTSEVFLDVWRQSGRFECRSKVSTWLLGIARNKALAARGRHRSGPLEEAISDVVEDTTGPELAVEDIDRSRLLRRILAGLPVKHREIIDLVYYHDKSVHEVSTILGIPGGTVKTRLFHARKHIARLLNEACVSRSLI